VSVAPDLVEAVVAWRVWIVREHGKSFRLSSVVYDTPWPARSEFVAECLRSPSLLPRRLRPRHEPPFDRCRCGIYATDEVKTLADYLLGFRSLERSLLERIFGQVSLWGTVVSCERGWRASHAYPSRLYVPARSGAVLPVADVARGLGDYGVPVEVVPCETRQDLARTLATADRV
jgi:hypothetical protein